MNVPCGFANFAIDPLYSSLILNGDNWADADFIPGMTLLRQRMMFCLRLRSVSCGFMIACAACAYFIVYSVFLICRMPDIDEDEIEIQSAEEVARKCSTTDKKETEFSSTL